MEKNWFIAERSDTEFYAFEFKEGTFTGQNYDPLGIVKNRVRFNVKVGFTKEEVVKLVDKLNSKGGLHKV